MRGGSWCRRMILIINSLKYSPKPGTHVDIGGSIVVRAGDPARDAANRMYLDAEIRPVDDQGLPSFIIRWVAPPEN